MSTITFRPGGAVVAAAGGEHAPAHERERERAGAGAGADVSEGAGEIEGADASSDEADEAEPSSATAWRDCTTKPSRDDRVSYNKHFFRFIAPPRLDASVRSWAWPRVRVGELRNRRGVFAKERLEAGLIIPHVGRVRMVDAHSAAASGRAPANAPVPATAAHAVDARFAFQVRSGRLTSTAVQVDADPALPECAGDLCLAGFVNEAFGNELYNCRFVNLHYLVTRDSMPHYPAFMNGINVFLVVMVAIEPGQELLAWRGPRLGAAGARRGNDNTSCAAPGNFRHADEQLYLLNKLASDQMNAHARATTIRIRREPWPGGEVESAAPARREPSPPRAEIVAYKTTQPVPPPKRPRIGKLSKAFARLGV